MGFPMTGTDIARAKHNRDRLRFPSDLTDREWAVVAPLIPRPRPGGRPRTTDMRDVMEAILFIASSGRAWRMLPGEFPPVSTVRGYFYVWRDNCHPQNQLWRRDLNEMALGEPARFRT